MIKKLIRSIKLSYRSDKEFYRLIFETTGFLPNNIELYKTAFIHRSASKYNKHGYAINNERLEYLGDAILGAIIADILYKYFPNKSEGFLTQLRSKIVSRSSLNKLAVDLGLDKIVVTNANMLSNTHINGDCLEALIGAIYLDQGYKSTITFIENKIFKAHIDIENILTTETNFKSKLIEWAQKYKRDISFKTHEDDKESTNIPTFIAEVEIGDITFGTGKGTSKKEAQQLAAKKALIRIEKEFIETEE